MLDFRLRKASWTNLGHACRIAVLTVGALACCTAAFPESAAYIENDTHWRYKGGRGLSKSRNTFQLETKKSLGAKGIFSRINLNATLRATYDAVYDLNPEEFGDEAGGPITLEQVGGLVPDGLGGVVNVPPAQVPFGQGIQFPAGGFSLAQNPNDGLEVLGTHLHDPDGGFTLAVPVRPCDEDDRGCIRGYMDADSNELRFPDFNDRQDWLREAYVEAAVPIFGSRELGIKLGKQQIVWGRTDLFRVLDVLNPVDFSRNEIFDELEDIRIPMWMLETEYRHGPASFLDELNLSVVWNFDKFRPHNLGQGGTPYQILGVGDLFRANKNLWDNGGTISNFAFGSLATDLPPNVAGIRDVRMPAWSWANTQIGAKLEGLTHGVGFSLNWLNFRSQLPSLHGMIPSVNPFDPAAPPVPHPFLPAFDIVFPRVTLFGGSLDFSIEKLKSVFRIEAAYTRGEEFANTLRPELFSESDVVRWVVGWDRETFIPFLNPTRAFLLSAQMFGEHLLDHELEDGPLGEVGMPNWKDNYTATLLIQARYLNDRLRPRILGAYDFRAEAAAIEPSFQWLLSDRLSLTSRWNVKVGRGARKFDDLRSANPFHPFTAAPGQTGPGSLGLGGLEPLGRFRSGALGMAQNEDEVSVMLRYAF